jgi:non-specific serine/threonine protein kinase
MIEPLTERELQILELISRGYSNREIADELVLTLATIKWYNKQIFSKLGVHNRTTAVATANNLGLLETRAESVHTAVSRPDQNFPVQITSFIGRDKETREVKRLLISNRLLTLTGAGGSGKTRLAIWAANDMWGEFEDGLYFVNLASIRDPGLLANAIAGVLEIQEVPGQELKETLKNNLRSKKLLLLLDNFEHILEASPLITELLSISQTYKFMVTSREPLQIYGEQVYIVPPLAVPDTDTINNLSMLSKYESVQLFEHRAASVNPDFKITEENIAAVVDICVRLDGLPLAIELAAARTRLFTPHMMSSRLHNRMDTLNISARDFPDRHHTLRAMLDWSYDLLEEDERILLARLSVFIGGSTLEGIEAVCAPGLSIDLMVHLESLVNKNMIFIKEELEGELRFYMLETIREYAYSRLVANSEEKEIKSLHAEYFSSLVGEADKELFQANQKYWYLRLRSDYSNIRAAVAWSLESGDLTIGACIIGALREYWNYEGHFIEAMRLVNRILAYESNLTVQEKAIVLNTACKMSFGLGDYEKGKQFGQEALSLSQSLDDELTRAWILNTHCSNLGAFPEDLEEAKGLCQESIDIFEKNGEQAGQARGYLYLGEIHRLLGDDGKAKEAYSMCLEINRKIGNKREIGAPLSNLSYIAMHEGEYKRAEQLAREGFRIEVEVMSNYYIAISMAMIAGPVAAQGYPERAAVLVGASNAIFESMGAHQQPSDQVELEGYLENIKAQIDEHTYSKALAKGEEMSLENAIAYALDEKLD